MDSRTTNNMASIRNSRYIYSSQEGKRYLTPTVESRPEQRGEETGTGSSSLRPRRRLLIMCCLRRCLEASAAASASASALGSVD